MEAVIPSVIQGIARMQKTVTPPHPRVLLRVRTLKQMATLGWLYSLCTVGSRKHTVFDGVSISHALCLPCYVGH